MFPKSYSIKKWSTPRLVLVAGFAALLALMAALTAVGLLHMSATQQRLGRIVSDHMRKIDLAGEMHRAARERTVSMQSMLLHTDPFDRDQEIQRFHRLATQFILARQALQQLSISPRERALLTLQGRLTGRAVPLQRRVVSLVGDDRIAEAHRVLIDAAIPAQNQVLETLMMLHRLQTENAGLAAARAKQRYNQTLGAVVAVSALIIGLGILIAVSVVRRSWSAELALLREKERAQVTLHSIGDAVVRTDEAGAIEYMNPAAERLSGWAFENARGRGLDQVIRLIHEGDRRAAADPLQALSEHNRGILDESDLVLITSEEDEHAVEITASMVHKRDHGAQGVVLVMRDVTEVRALAREVEYRATHDTMTGLLNRTEFERRLMETLRTVRQDHREHALCYLDLDLFKVVNDSCGHLAGDELLRQLGLLMRQRVRAGDLLARLGGDEFGLLLHGCALTRASELADQIRASVRDFHFVWEDKSFDIGVSIGVVRVSADSGDLKDVLRAADTACQSAKELGRNRVYAADPNDLTMHRRQKEIDWVQRMNQAIAHDRFHLFGQWIEPLSRPLQDPTHCEVLLRLLDDRDEIVSPQAFLPAAERYHLMPAIDRWVVTHTLEFISELAWDKLENFGSFHINLSGQSLGDPEFVDFLADAVTAHGIPSHRLCFEITETAAITNLSSAMELIGGLRRRGCRFALDDFGSGLSSFSYLKQMSVDCLKIDGAFVRNIARDPTDLAMVNSINQVAHSMGIRTVAEYAQTREIRRRLKRLGVDYCQGNLVETPKPLAIMMNEIDAVRATKARTGTDR